MSLLVPQYASIKFPELNCSKVCYKFGTSTRSIRVFAVAMTDNAALNSVPAAPMLLPEGPWKQIPGGVTAANGFKAAGMYGGLRAKGEKPDLALLTCDVDATSAGAFTTNVVAAAPVVYCKGALEDSRTARAVLINAGQANAATGDAGYQDVIECSNALAKLLQVKPEKVLIESTGVIGQRIKKEALLNSLPKLVNLLSPTAEGANSAAVAITTTDLVSKSVAIESEFLPDWRDSNNSWWNGKRFWDDSSEYGHNAGCMFSYINYYYCLSKCMFAPFLFKFPNFQVITTDALVKSDVWRKMVKVSVTRSFNQITVDGDTSTNDAVIALASGLSGSNSISSLDSSEAKQLQLCLDAVMQGLAKSIASDGEGATCLIEVTVTGAGSEVEAAKVARSVASSSLAKAAVYGRDPNWGRIACAAGYAGIPFNPNALRISLGDILLMDYGQPLPFDRDAASNYLRSAGEIHGTVQIQISIGDGPGNGMAWGCDLSYDYVKINAEYTT